ncbi:P27 family predicted phage terminase small subunit [Paraburkholderia sp. BL8N3]|nr:phage terminase small subunit P27 family [Paraburkholderia sp. BL8N3]TCK37982.1 P27 family predicted phage terminase small subunit [Paraburkholderia sp. BL8N3]
MPTRGAKPKPTALRVIQGTRKSNIAAKHEPKPRAGIPPCPSHLDARAREEWNRITPELLAAGVLSTIDGAVLASYCVAYSRWQDAEDALARMKARDKLTAALMIKTTNGNAIQNPLVGVANRAMLLCQRFACEFGMTPAARARIEADPNHGNEQDPAQAYF